jgi:hypothetical protein
LSDAKEPQAEAAAAPQPIEWPRCGYCGSPRLRESRRGGFTESCLRWAGCTLYRCEHCERRFGFATLGHPHRRHLGERVPLKPRNLDEKEARVVSGGRRRTLGVLATLLAALVTFLAASWLISQSERRRLEGEATPPSP